jgi:histidine triad (HIT) family protein
MKKCIFCKIIEKNTDSEVIYEDDWFLAFLDENPIIEGHSLLITKRHNKTIWDLNNIENQKLGVAMKQVSDKLGKKFGQNINIVNTSGEYASQSIPHIHFHLIPRKKGDRLWDEKKSKIILDRSSGFKRLESSKEELKNLAEEIR